MNILLFVIIFFIVILMSIIPTLINISVWGSPFLSKNDEELIRTALHINDEFYPCMYKDDATMLHISKGYITTDVSGIMLKYAVSLYNENRKIILQKTIFRWNSLTKEIDAMFKKSWEDAKDFDLM